MIETLEKLKSAVATVPREKLPTVLGALREMEASIMLRLHAVPSPSKVVPHHDELLDIEQAAARLSVSKPWLYANWKTLPFARKLEWGLRFSAKGIEEYISREGRP